MKDKWGFIGLIQSVDCFQGLYYHYHCIHHVFIPVFTITGEIPAASGGGEKKKKLGRHGRPIFEAGRQLTPPQMVLKT